ncbi:hypothetical protein SAMN04487969_102570 [Paenibacillus algorifonticola]|uniref:Uncharacterized protein n=2 Tax=Paenibacillus algorifonticola TaxID=684063 RepID=A0A1I2APE8_9BACL|nr:hypothetical protein [Paenibacillus algorifonticola]SFE44760.1 hypothetical protein SAMN04487969_102570 [Paenibacillus algorifonticola]
MRDQLTKVMAQRRKRSGEGTVEAEEGASKAQVLGAASSEAWSAASNAAKDAAPNEASMAKEQGEPNSMQPSVAQLTALPKVSVAEQPNEEWKAFYEAVSTYVSKMRD